MRRFNQPNTITTQIVSDIEKPQAGRLRHFHQFGIEVFGTSDMLADAEVISLGYDFLTELGITEIQLRINSVGCPDCRRKYRDAFKRIFEA